MRDELKIDALVDIVCKNCGKRTTVPALKVEPGVKCRHCGAILEIGIGEYAAKAVMLNAAAGREDVKAD